MTKIKNTGAYPIKKYPIPSDFFIGSDSENNGETINFEIQKIINMASGLKDYIFSMSSLPIVSPQGDGYFQTNGIKNFALITTLSISKKTLAGQDLTPFMTWLGSNLTEFTLYIVSKTNQNIFADFAITSVTEQTDYFVFTVTFAPGDNYLGELIEKDIYTFNYEKTAAGSVLDLLTQVITDGDTHHAPSADAVYDALFLKAPLASPALTGVPTAPTAAPGTNTIQLANTSFVTAALTLLDATLLHKTGNEVKTGTLTVNSIIRAGGLSTQFLKADGSIDSNTYLTAETDTLQSVTNRGAVTTTSLTALSFIKTGGLASQFLKANGSIDANVYALDSSVIHNTGNETKTGTLTVNSIIKAGGTASQFLKADGSSDATVYAVDSTVIHTTGNEVKTGTLTVNSIIRAGGLSTQFLKADGSIDSNTYLTAESDTLQSVTARGATTTLGITALSFIKSGGTASQYLMADGSVTTLSNIIAPTIVDGDTAHAPSGEAVYEALLLKTDLSLFNSHVTNFSNPHNTTAIQIPATPHVDYLTGANVQLQLDNTETTVVSLAKTNKINFKDIYQTGRVRIDTDNSVLSISPADTLNITLVDDILFVNEVVINTNANKLADFLLSFGTRVFVASGANTPLAINTRGIFYVGINKLGNAVYQTAKIYDQDVCYLARILVENNAGVYTIISFKYFPDLANNRVNNRDRLTLSSGYIVPSGAASISFGNRAITYGRNSINYSNNKFDPNFLSLADSVNPTPMSFLFFLPNITSLATSLALSTVMNPTQWYTAGGAIGGTAVSNTNYQVYKLFVTVTGTIGIQTKASTSNAPAPGINAIFANREDALAGLTSVVFPEILPAGDSIGLGTFYLRAGTNVNGSGLTDPNDFYFLPYTSSSSSSTVGVTTHDALSGKNDNPAFQHVTTTDISNWNVAYTNRITALTTTGSSGASTLIANTLNIPNYTLAGLGGQPQLNGTGFVKATGTVISYDNTTYQPLLTNPVTGTGANGQVAFWNGTNTQTGDNEFLWNNTTKSLGVGISPIEKLHVLGNGLFQTPTPSWATSAAGLQISGSDSGATSYISAYLDSSVLQIGAGTTQKTGIIINGQSSVLGSTIQFSTGGSEKMRITSNGNVGIGTTSPNAKFTARVASSNGSAHTDGITINDADTNPMGLSLGVNTTSSYSWIQSLHQGFAYEKLALNPNGGNVLIGTTTDNGNRLQVNGSAWFNGGLDVLGTILPRATEAIRLINDNGYVSAFDSTNASRSGYIQFETSPGRITIQSEVGIKNINLNPSGGNVLIGTSSDNGVDKLQVAGGIKATGQITGESFRNVGGYSFSGNDFIFMNGDGSWYQNLSALNANFYGAVNTPDYRTSGVGYITYDADNAGTGTLVIRAGTLSDVAMFGATGNFSVGSPLTANQKINTSGLFQSIDGKNQYLKIGMEGDTAVIATDWFSGYGGAYRPMSFWTGGAERLNIATNGNSTFYGSVTANGGLVVPFGAVYSRDGIWLRPDGVDRLLMRAESGSGDFKIYQYDSGAGYLRDTLTIPNATGNVLIGTNSDNGYKLRVNGPAYFDSEVFATGRGLFTFAGGNSYSTCSLEVRGNGSSDTVFPTIGFHQPSLYAFTISARSAGFFFMDIDGTGRSNIYANSGDFTGAVTASGGFFNSDARLKDIISRDGDVAYFKWKDGRDDKTHVGYLAQEVQEKMPDAIQEGSDGMLSVNYVEVLITKIAQLEKKIIELESKLN